MQISREQVEAIKLSVKQLPYQGISIEKTLIGSMESLKGFYETFNDSKYLESILPLTAAYLEMGYPYDAYADFFDGVLKELEIDRVMLFPRYRYVRQKIAPTRAQIKRAIGTWNASRYHTMPIREVLDDIIDKTIKKQEGTFDYHSNKRPDGKGIDRHFVLMVGPEETVLKDMQKDIYYVLDDSMRERNE